MSRNPVDIIIPVYNAYEDLKKCVSSIEKYTDLFFDRLILINDCSSDERIVPYLQSLKDGNIVFINNDVNEGFSNNVNKGMLYSEDRDVILLNSDTIVTKHWVNKLYECAYSKSEIGTVTPMSNSATLCSYPIMCLDNEIPEHLTIDELGDIIERCSMHVYPRITVAVGFCMFIKRTVIQKVGLFDAETFGRGYGEENDFCNRAEQFGYIHVMCDDTFIYHKGTASFISEEKQKLIEEHDKILCERYPTQMERNSKYCNQNPDQYIRDNIDIYAKADPRRKNIMYVIHSDFRDDAMDSVGGTQFHVRDLVANLKNEYNVYVAARDRDFLRVTMYSSERMVSLEYYIGEKDTIPRARDSHLFVLFLNLLKAFRIDILHVHHTYGLSFDMIYAAHELHIPVVLTMHDYYYICPNVKLINCDNVYCNGYECMDDCNACLKSNVGIATGTDFLSNWRKTCREMLRLCNRIIIPSKAAKKIVGMYYPDLEDKITVIEHGLVLAQQYVNLSSKDIHEDKFVHVNWDYVLDNSENRYLICGWNCIEGIDASDVIPYLEITVNSDTILYFECARTARPDVAAHYKDERYFFSGFSCNVPDECILEKNIKIRMIMQYDNRYYTNNEVLERYVSSEQSTSGWNVAFIGGMVPGKGSRKALEMIRAVKEKINWHIFGTILDSELLNMRQDNLFIHGTYCQQELPQLMRQYQIDIVCILPIWPETFCYTISEAIACDVPVFVTDIGAVGERVKRYGYGWTVPIDMTGSKMAEKLQNILEDTNEYESKKRIASDFEEISLHDMTQEYRTLYNELPQREVSYHDFDRKLVYEGIETLSPKEQWKQERAGQKSMVREMDVHHLFEEERIQTMATEINQLNSELNCIKNGRLYRIERKIKQFFGKC